MYTTTQKKQEKLVVEAPKARNKQLHDVLSGRHGGRFENKRKSRANDKQEMRRSFKDLS